MSDLISRQDAIDALEAKKDKTAKGNIGQFYNTIIQHDIDALMDLPSAQPEPQWIPCSEWLPGDGTYVLGYMAYGQCSVLKCEGGRLYTAGCWVPLPKNAVTHWQYLPDAPKGAER